MLWNLSKTALACAFTVLATAAYAVCPSPITGKDGGGTIQNFGDTVDASGNCYGNVGIVDGAAAANKLTITAGGAAKVDGSAVTQPVSASALPLPTGASTAAKQPALGTAGTASTDVLTVQGIASMTPLLANPGTAANWGVGAFASAMVANGQAICLYDGTNCIRAKGDETNGLWVNVKNSTTAITPAPAQAAVSSSPVAAFLMGYNGATFDPLQVDGNKFLKVIAQAGSAIIGKIGIDQTTFGTTNGVVSSATTYQAVAASQTATVLQTSTGATGDYLSHCTIYPTSTSPGVVTVFDSTNTAANSAILFAGGASSLSNLVPFAIPVGAKSVNGAWKVTTGASVSVVCEGKFS